MDLTHPITRLAAEKRDHAIFTYEGGKAVRRTAATLGGDVNAACARLQDWNVKPGMRVGIRSENCYSWLVYDLALIELRALSVAFTSDFNGVSAKELFRRYGLSLLLDSAAEIARAARAGVPVACIDGPNGAIAAGDQPLPEPDPEFERPALVFSSGSSGGLKGIILNRRGVEASADAFAHAVRPRNDDRLLLFLPMSNYQQRMMCYAGLWYGIDLVITDPLRLFRALKELRPTILIAPPVLYENFENRFYGLSRCKRWSAQAAADLVKCVPVASARARLARAIFAEAYEALGGRMRFMVTGMAPTKRSTLLFFRRMQLPLFETYGLLECGSISLNVLGACRIGSVGRLLPGASVEFAADGEIIARRDPPMVQGYFECAPGESEKTFLEGHWVATGDIGCMDEQGYLHLLGRKKEIIVTANGEKIHPEVLEAEIDACAQVAKSVVFSACDNSTLVVVVVPRIPSNPAARSRIEEFVDHLSLRRPALVNVRLLFSDAAFSRENGFLRPNLKLDRPRIARHFQQQLAIKTDSGRARGQTA